MENLAIIITTVLAGVLTYSISVNIGKGAVFGSAIVTLLAGLFLPHFFENGAALAVAATTASYAGMVAGKNVPNLLEMAAVGLIVGVVFILGAPTYIGVGGRLGAMAALSCFSWIGIKKTYRVLIKKEKKSKEAAAAPRMR
jgi:hypothetical protein